LVDSAGLTYPYYRIRLAEYICALLPASGECTILDIGSGEGLLDEVVHRYRPATRIVGVDTYIRPNRNGATPVAKIDGVELPFRDRAFDVAMLINVLHHADDQRQLMHEAYRVARRCVIVKDHVAGSWLEYQKLALLDVIGNAGSGAVVRGHYLSDGQWQELFATLPGARVAEYRGLSFRRGILLTLFRNELDVIFEVKRYDA
jgi:SAM-dependent methyltransferase